MITELTFARDFSSFWRVATPTLDGFIHQVNSGLYDRDAAPMKAPTGSNRRAFVNEVAFELYCRVALLPKAPSHGNDLRNFLDASVAAVRKATNSPLPDSDYHNALRADEQADVLEQVRRLRARLTPASAPQPPTPRPRFPGCGIINTCYGDILAGETLFEIKAGDRSFRSVDVRQILTYLALNYASGTHRILRAGLVNPRVGTSIELGVDDLCYQVSGQDRGGLLGGIAHAISSGGISR